MLMIQFEGSQSDQLTVMSLGIVELFRDFNSTVLFYKSILKQSSNFIDNVVKQVDMFVIC